MIVLPLDKVVVSFTGIKEPVRPDGMLHNVLVRTEVDAPTIYVEVIPVHVTVVSDFEQSEKTTVGSGLRTIAMVLVTGMLPLPGYVVGMKLVVDTEPDQKSVYVDIGGL